MQKAQMILCLTSLGFALSSCESHPPVTAASSESAYQQTIDQINLLYRTVEQLTPSITAGSTVTATPAHTQSFDPTISATPTISRTPNGEPCYRARVLSEIPAPYYGQLAFGEHFVKTWTILNTGACRWPANVQLVYVRVTHNLTADILDQMSGPDQQPIGVEVGVGETVDVSVALVAPLAPGQYAGYWMLRNTAGGRFGEGWLGESAFSVSLSMRARTPTQNDATNTSILILTPTPTATTPPFTPTAEIPTVSPTAEMPMPTNTETPTQTNTP
jgi:hypothetical protein